MEDHGKSQFLQQANDLMQPAVQKRIAERVLLEFGDPSDLIWFQWPQLRCTPEEEDLFGRRIKLDDFQYDIVRAAFDPTYQVIAIKGCTEAGKGLATSLIVNLWYDVYDDARIILSGPKFSQVKNVMMAEVREWRNKMVAPYSCEVNNEDFVDDKRPKHSLKINVPNSGEGFSGTHSEHVLVIFDEASDVEDFFFENAKEQARLVIALSNPRTLSGWFRRLFPDVNPDETQDHVTEHGKARCVTVSALDLINVRKRRLTRPVAPLGGIKIAGVQYEYLDRIPPEHYKFVRPLIPAQKDYASFKEGDAGRDEMRKRVFTYGQFPKEDRDNMLILPSWLKRHQSYWRHQCDGGAAIPIEAVGADIAVSPDGDDTAIAAGGRLGCRAVVSRQGAAPEETAPWIVDTLKGLGVDITIGEIPVAIDTSGGYGDGVRMLLNEWGCWVVGIHSSAKPEFDRQRYDTNREELWGELARRLDPHGDWPDPHVIGDDAVREQVDDQPWGLPDNLPDMIEGMIAQRKLGHTAGKLRLIPKKRYRRKTAELTVADLMGGKSPDKADAVCLLYRAVMILDREDGRSVGPVTIDRPLFLLTPEEQRMLAPPPEDRDPVQEMMAKLSRLDKEEAAWNTFSGVR